MLWITYSCSVVFFSLLVAKFGKKKDHKKIFIIFLVILLTPAQIEVSGLDYAPSLFTFILNISFQQDFSLRVLRPLLLTSTFTLVSVLIYSAAKRRFF